MKRRGADVIVAVTLTALGILLLIDAREISFGVGYDRIGPRFFPYLVSAGLILLGVVLVGGRVRRGFTPRHHSTDSGSAELVEGQAGHKSQPYETPTPGSQPHNWRALLYIGGALVLFVILLDRAGFIVASCIQFWLVARALQSARPVRDLIVGFFLAIVVYVGFSRGLGLTLPAGVLF
jgi:putative tricarboxylic transport membrane protein